MPDLLKLNFLKKGLLTLVVDNNQIGFQKYGLPVGGPMDSESAQVANWLVGNKSEAPLIEINMVGPRIKFDHKCQISITGANLTPTIEGKMVPMYQTVNVAKSSVLQFGKLENGCRAYLAIGGDWNTPNWFGSSIIGDKLNSIYIDKIDSISIRSVMPPKTPKKEVTLRVLEGPEFSLMKVKTRNKLIDTPFKILPASNRMGFRLSPQLPSIGKSIISSGVVPGTLQITEDGHPILLMQDAPATGGYLRALNIISEDLSKLGQLKAGDTIKLILNYKVDN